MNKNFSRLMISSLIVGGLNFSPIIFDADNNFQIISVARAEVQTYVASDTAMFDFGEDDEKIVATVKNVAKMRAEQAAKEKAGVYLKSYSKTVNGMVTDDDIKVFTSNTAEVVDVKYKKLPYEAHDVQGQATGKIGFMYEATVTVKIDTAELSKYINRDAKEKSDLISQNKNLQKSAAEVNQNFENLRKTSENKNTEQIKTEVTKIDNEILIQQKLAEAARLYYQDNYKAAISKYDEVIQLNPNHSAAYCHRGWNYLLLGNYNQALADCSKAVQLDSNSEWNYLNRGNVYFALNNFNQAVIDYNETIRLNPNSSMAYNNRGYCYANLQNFNQALADYNKAIELDSNNVIAYNNRGNLYFLMQNFNQALADYNKAIQLDSTSAMAYTNRGWLYYQLKNYSQAIADCTKAIELDKNFALAYKNRGVAYADSGNYSKAVEDFTKVLQFEPNNATIYYVRGLCYQALGNEQAAQADFAKAQQLGFTG